MSATILMSETYSLVKNKLPEFIKYTKTGIRQGSINYHDHTFGIPKYNCFRGKHDWFLNSSHVFLSIHPGVFSNNIQQALFYFNAMQRLNYINCICEEGWLLRL